VLRPRTTTGAGDEGRRLLERKGGASGPSHQMVHWGWNTAGIGAVLVVAGAVAVLWNEGPVGLRHPRELTGMLGWDRRRARWSHYLLLVGIAAVVVGVVVAVTGAVLNGLGW
jgi:hypothetical protein